MFQSLSFLVGVSPPDMYSVIYHSLILFRVTALFGPGGRGHLDSCPHHNGDRKTQTKCNLIT